MSSSASPVPSRGASPASVLEIAIVTAIVGEEEGLAAAYPAALTVVLEHSGARRGTVRRQVEDPRTFALLIEWDSVAAHHDFGGSKLLQRFRAELGGRVEAGAAAHYVTIAEAEG